MKKPALPLLFSWSLVAACHPSQPYTQAPPLTAPANVTRVQVIHFSDYHAHAVPYFSEHESGVAGIARALAYVKQTKAADPNLLVLNGGDMFNTGTPAWSDKYGKDCTEWKWWNGIVTAMAFGNHDVDYGWDSFVGCQKQSQYPVLSGNLLDASDNGLLSADGVPYLVKKVGDIKIGMFALAGSDFTSLVKAANLPAGAKFADPLAAAQRIVKTLREQEKVDAVIFFGHQTRESDFEMARQVPGIDLILGTHSHYKGEFQTIPGTKTSFISPFQYMNYLSHVELIFTNGALDHISGRLVRMSPGLAEDSEVSSQVTQMERALESDPMYSSRFQVIGQAAVELDFTNIDRGESVLGNFVMDTVRTAGAANLAFSTASSFRASIPPGSIRMEDYLTSVPYKNNIMQLTMTGDQVQELLNIAVGKVGSDTFAVSSGVRYSVVSGKAQDIAIAKDPASRTSDYEPLRTDGTYTVATTNFMTDNAPAGYKATLDKASAKKDTGLIVNDTVISYIKASSPVSAKVEGRINPTPAPLPTPTGN